LQGSFFDFHYHDKKVFLNTMHPLNFTPFPVLKTPRLILRQLELTDENEIFVLRSDEEVNKYVDRPRATSLEDARTFINKIGKNIADNVALFWVITIDDAFAGTICLWNIDTLKEKAETGYELLPQFQGKGIMQEALMALLQYGFEELGLNCIEAWLHKENERSVKLLEKYKFNRDKTAEAHMDKEEKEMGVIIYSLYKTGGTAS
jgi:[ribosomal protein S5]-alanine N-acetyltransferase